MNVPTVRRWLAGGVLCLGGAWRLAHAPTLAWSLSWPLEAGTIERLDLAQGALELALGLMLVAGRGVRLVLVQLIACAALAAVLGAPGVFQLGLGCRLGSPYLGSLVPLLLCLLLVVLLPAPASSRAAEDAASDA